MYTFNFSQSAYLASFRPVNSQIVQVISKVYGNLMEKGKGVPNVTKVYESLSLIRPLQNLHEKIKEYK